jgi:hypothetical protein
LVNYKIEYKANYFKDPGIAQNGKYNYNNSLNLVRLKVFKPLTTADGFCLWYPMTEAYFYQYTILYPGGLVYDQH